MAPRKTKKFKEPIISEFYQPEKMKLLTLINSVEALNKLLETKLPAKVAFKLGRFSTKVSPDVESFHKLRLEKMKEFGTIEVDADGKETDKYRFEKEAGEKFVAEIKAVEESEISVEIPDIKVEDLGDISIEPKYLSVLEWLIKE